LAADITVKPINIAFISTYPPRQCGIGTFTSDLFTSLKNIYNRDGSFHYRHDLQVVALNNIPHGYVYPEDVAFEIREMHKSDYLSAADYINLSPVSVVSLQHEYGIFGGADGENIIDLLLKLKKPAISTLHTVLRDPSPGQRKVLGQICSLSTQVVVIAGKAIPILEEIYAVPRKKISLIHHGTPDIPFLDPSYYKDQLHEGRKVILTFGLINPNKGIEYAIKAVKHVVEKHPEVLYIVLGTTHPDVKRHFGEQYRLSLEKMVQELGLEDNVVFHNRFVSIEQLTHFLVASDIYLTPYLGREQISSGTLAYAVACGKAIISTPYWYAEELLADGRGLLVPFRDSEALAEKLLLVLDDEVLRNRMRKQAYGFGRRMIWEEVSREYLQVFDRALTEYSILSRSAKLSVPRLVKPVLPEINLTHLYNLTDDTGVYQHAVFSTPDRFHGYCTDDNARALILAVMNWRLNHDRSIFPLLQVTLAFLNHAIDPETGRARNFLTFDRRWLEKPEQPGSSEDSHGRLLWALGYTIAFAPTEAILGLCLRLFKQATLPISSFSSPRAWAFIILGCSAYLKRFGGDTDVRNIASRFSRRLLELFQNVASPQWPWCEEIVSYDNARLPHALILAGQYEEGKENEQYLEYALTALKWLLNIQTNPSGGNLSIIGNQDWFVRGREQARFDQQPLDAAALVEACFQAFLTTGEDYWRQEMSRIFQWFQGHNDLNLPLIDYISGACFDGINPTGLNQNQGAESTLSYLMALHRMHLISHKGLEQQDIFQLETAAGADTEDR